MKNLFIFSVVLFLAGCQGFNVESLGVDQNDNAVQCLKTEYTGTWAKARVNQARVEFPAGMVTTPEQMLQAMELLCD